MSRGGSQNNALASGVAASALGYYAGYGPDVRRNLGIFFVIGFFVNHDLTGALPGYLGRIDLQQAVLARFGIAFYIVLLVHLSVSLNQIFESRTVVPFSPVLT
jgi:uncharacterized membrane protein YjjP (DUF1212 family)